MRKNLFKMDHTSLRPSIPSHLRWFPLFQATSEEMIEAYSHVPRYTPSFPLHVHLLALNPQTLQHHLCKRHIQLWINFSTSPHLPQTAHHIHPRLQHCFRWNHVSLLKYEIWFEDHFDQSFLYSLTVIREVGRVVASAAVIPSELDPSQVPIEKKPRLYIQSRTAASRKCAPKTTLNVISTINMPKMSYRQISSSQEHVSMPDPKN